MKCPACGAASAVIETRDKPNQLGTKRRRKCIECSTRFATLELQIEDVHAGRAALIRLARVRMVLNEV